MKSARAPQAGFTLIEIMVVLALVAVIASLALPALGGSSKTKRMQSEVNAFVGELRLRQEAFMAEQGRYLSTGASETDMFPAAIDGTPQDISSPPATWTQLEVKMPMSQAACSYVVISGNSAMGSAGPMAVGSFSYVKPSTRSWYYVLARCTDGKTDTYFFASNDDAKPRMIGDVTPPSYEGTATQAIPVPKTDTVRRINSRSNR
ncbi:MAG TPA: type II secretion system protein [Kofleriaceae bacterium]|nr:type II secretion system protein [Kofleriaceae bacterium]